MEKNLYKIYIKQTVKDVMMKVVKINNGCWICHAKPTFRVLHNGVPQYLISAIFDYYKKPKNGKIIRSCGNFMCINPNHLFSPTKTEKFWSNIYIKEDDDCWEWKSLSGTDEYGETHFDGKNDSTHRIAWKLTYGEIPKGLYVLHKCDNPPCCNPKHLFLGTHQDNVDDRERKGRNKMPHSTGENHGQHKLTEKQVIEIRNLYAMGNTSYRKLSSIYKVNWSAIRSIVKRWNWSWLE